MKKYLPILTILTLMLAVYFTGFYRALDFDTLKYHHYELIEYVNNNPIMTPFMFMGAYAASTALSIPGRLILTLLGGFLFRQPLCTLYVVIGATTGATLLFLSAKIAIESFFKKRSAPFLKKMESGFKKNAVSYMLFLRFVPLIPFWLGNLIPAFFRVRLRSYIWTTLVGITPSAIVFTQAGRGLGEIFETSDDFSLASVLNIETKIALFALGIFALIPVFVKKWRNR